MGKGLKFYTWETPILGSWRYGDPWGEGVGCILSSLCQAIGMVFYVLESTVAIGLRKHSSDYIHTHKYERSSFDLGDGWVSQCTVQVIFHHPNYKNNFMRNVIQYALRSYWSNNLILIKLAKLFKPNYHILSNINYHYCKIKTIDVLKKKSKSVNAVSKTVKSKQVKQATPQSIKALLFMYLLEL